MNPIDRVVGNPQSVHPSSSSSAFSLPLSRLTRIFKAGVLGALALGSPAAGSQARVRYDGGVTIPLPDFAALEAPRQEFGPVYTHALQCLIIPRENCAEKTASSLSAYAETVHKIPEELAPYIEKAGDIAPTYATPLERFPENLSAFFSNGLGAVGNGEKACVLDGDVGTYLKCDKEAKLLAQLIKYEGMEKAIYTGNPDDNGLILYNKAAKVKPIHVVVRNDPQDHANFHAALKHVEETWLQDPCFFDKTEEELLQEIIHLHSLIVGKKDSRLRTQRVLVSRTKGNSLEDYIKKLQEMKVSQKEIRLFKESYTRVTNVEKLTKAERAIWEKLIYFPTDAKEVPGLMRTFVSKLKEYARSDWNPIALAAKLHGDLGTIHPFGDGNGRLARLILNIFLKKGGYPPVIFPDDDEYSAYVNADQAVPGTFAGYLSSLIETQRKGTQVLSYGEKHEPGILEYIFSYF